MTNKQRYIIIYHDGSRSISDSKLTPDGANELWDDSADYEPACMFNETEAEKIARGILALIDPEHAKKCSS